MGRGGRTRTLGLAVGCVVAALLACSAAPALATDGTGSMIVSPTSVTAGSTGNTLTFTFTAGSGGMSNGQIDLTIPAGWPAPSESDNFSGFFNETCDGSPGGNPDSVSGQTIVMPAVTLSAGQTCQVVYGEKFGPAQGVTAPTSTGSYTFTAREASIALASGGVLTAIQTSPSVAVSADGTGTMGVSPTHVVAGSMLNTMTFTYATSSTASMSSGELTIAVPAGWSAPSTNSLAAGYTTTTCPGGTVQPSGMTIQVTGVTLGTSSSCTITYGDATAPSAGGGLTAETFTAQQEGSTSDNNLVALGSSPQVFVTAADGAGTMTVSPTNAIQGSTGNTLTFTYTAPSGGLTNGNIDLTIPSGWPAPSETTGNQGFFADNCSAHDSVSSQTIVITQLYMTGGQSCTVVYGSTFSSPGATAPSTEGPYTFTTTEQSYGSSGALTAIASSPVVQVGSDGTGTMALVSPAHVIAGSAGNTLTFKYTAGVSVSGGELTIALPSGWSPPSTSSSAGGYTTTTCAGASVQPSGQTIAITNLTLSNGSNCTVTYGDTSGTGPGATAQSTGGFTPVAFTTQEKSSSGGVLTTLGSGSPSVIVTAGDGAGTMTVSPTSVITGTAGNHLTFTYTAPSGGLDNGNIDITIPSGWPAPSETSGNQGFFADGCSIHDSVSGQTIVITQVSMNGGSSCQITYGAGSPGATAPSTNGGYTFTTTEQSYGSSGALTQIATSPTVTAASDGLGTMGVSPTHVVVGSTGNTLTFTYTAASTITNAEITIALPNGWSPATNAGSGPGATTATCGVVNTPNSGSTIDVVNVAVLGGTTCTITYSDATAPSSGGTNTFATEEQSSGTLTPLAAGSPSVSVTAADGAGTMSVSPTTAVNNSTNNQLNFTYTAPAGGLDHGKLTIAVPAGWSTPQTSQSNAAGYVIDGCGNGNPSVAGSTITVTGVTVADAGSCQVIYHDATAPAGSGLSTFTTQEASTATGTLTAITAPTVNVSDDGTGTLNVAPTTASAGATGNTLTFTYNSTVALAAGEVTIAVPAGWSSPTTTGTDPGYTTSTCGSVAVAGSTIQVTNISLAGSSSCTITYGDTGSGGQGATAPSTPGAGTFSAEQKSSSGGTLTALASSPQVTVYAPDGSGTLTPAPSFSTPGSNGNTITFTYTAAAGGVNHGTLLVAVPAGWSSPSTVTNAPGYTSSTCGNAPSIVGGDQIQVTGVTLAAAGTCTITYGDNSHGGGGVMAPSTPGASTFATREQSSLSGLATAIASSPVIDITSADGSGTMNVAPQQVSTGSTGNTLTFTYTADTGGTHGGALTLAVPAGWSAASTTATDPGYTTSTCGTVGVSSGVIQVTGVTLPGGGTCTVTYGDMGSGGPGATAPPSDAAGTFTSQEKSTSGGSLTSLASSPSVSNSAPKTLTVSLAGTGTGTVTGNGISCPGTCSKSYPPGTAITLTATPDSSSTFTGWSGACTGTGTCQVTMSSDMAVTATFAQASTGGGGSGGSGGGSGGGGGGSGGGGGGGTGGGGGGGSGGGGGKVVAPSCSLTPVSSKVTVRKHQGTLSLKATCNQTVSGALSGSITEVIKGKHGSRHTKVVQLGAVHASFRPRTAQTLVVTVPAGALSALQGGTKESASFVLTVRNANGTTKATAAISALRT